MFTYRHIHTHSHSSKFCFLFYRYMFGLSAIPAILQFLGFLFLPESPRWLIQKGQTQKARRVLSQIRGVQTIDEEYDGIKNSIDEEEKEAGAGTNPFICLLFLYKPLYLIYNLFRIYLQCCLFLLFLG